MLDAQKEPIGMTWPQHIIEQLKAYRIRFLSYVPDAIGEQVLKLARHDDFFISFIENEEVIKKILKHLGLWDLKSKPPPRANAPPDNIEPHLDYSDSQLPPPARHRSRSGEAGGSMGGWSIQAR
jgi:hypothetical protein